MYEAPDGFPPATLRDAFSSGVTKKRLKRPIPKAIVKHKAVALPAMAPPAHSAASAIKARTLQ
jgi:hypothetical protein